MGDLKLPGYRAERGILIDLKMGRQSPAPAGTFIVSGILITVFYDLLRLPCLNFIKWYYLAGEVRNALNPYVAMSQKKQSFQDRLNQRRNTSFVGREQEIELFRQNLTRTPDDEQYYFLFNLHGQGGVGKTTLVQKFQGMAKEQNFLSVYTNETIKDTLEFMEEVAKQMRDQDAPLKTFEERYQKYQEEKEKLEKSPDAPKGGFFSLIARTSAKVGMHYAKKALGEEALAEMVDSDAVSSHASEWIDYIYKRVTNKDERQLILEPVEALTPLLFKDLNKHCETRKICWFIDTYEETSRFLDEWLRFLLEGRFGETPENLLFVIAGRDELDPNVWSSFNPVIRRFSIEPFTREEACRFLTDHQITNPQVIEDLLEISMRLPVLLTMLADMVPNSSDVPADISGTAVKRFLKWIEDPVQQRIALHAALPRQLNQDILAVLLEEGEDPAYYFNWLKDRPFVHKRGQYWAYHNVVRELMAQYQFELSQQSWSGLQTRLAKHYEQQAASLGIKDLENQWKDDTWETLMMEAHFHWLCADLKKAIPAAVQACVQVMRINEFHDALPWALTIHQAGKYWEDTYWGKYLQEGINGLIAEKWKIAIPVFSKINQAQWLQSDDAAFCHFVEGWLASELKNSLEAIECYLKAIEFKPDKHEAWNNMGNAYSSLGQKEKAIECYLKAIEFKPDKYKAWYNMGYEYASLDQKEKAIECYLKAIEFKPDDDAAWYNMGNAYSSLDQKEKAIECYLKAVEFKPDKHEAWYNMGNAYSSLGQKEKAIECYLKAIEFKPDKYKAWYNMGYEYASLDQKEKAIECYLKAIEFKPDHNKAWFDLGYSYFQISKMDESIHAFEQASFYSRIDFFTPRVNIAFLKLRQGKVEESKMLSQAIWEESLNKEPFAAKNLGHYYIFQNEHRKALEWYQLSLPLWENPEEFFNHLDTDFDNLQMSSHHLPRETYDAILAKLKNAQNP